MRRALTMIEMLLSLGLLTAVLLAVAGWTRTIARVAADGAGPAQRDASVEAVFRLIQDDLLVGDLGSAGTAGGSGSARAIDITGGVLEIDTRRRGAHSLMGPVTHRYRVIPGRRELTRQMSGLGGQVITRVLLDDVRTWKCAVDDTSTMLTVTITASDDREWERRFRL